jgi:hypothetical protein
MDYALRFLLVAVLASPAKEATEGLDRGGGGTTIHYFLVFSLLVTSPPFACLNLLARRQADGKHP